MQHNLRYLENGQGVLDPDEPDPTEFGPDGEPLTEAASYWAEQQERQEADAPGPTATAPPPGYLTVGQDDALEAPATAPRPPVDLPHTTSMRGPLSASYPVFRSGRSGPFIVDTPVSGARKHWTQDPSGDLKSSPIAPVVPFPEDNSEWVAGGDQPSISRLPVKLPGSGTPGKDYGLQEALDTQRQIEARYPIRPMPKLLNRIGAGALGAAAGWSNAAGRSAPIDTKALTEAVLYPGYDRQLAKWQSQEDAAKLQVANFGQQVGAQYASQKAQADTQLKFAQAEAAIKKGDYWERRSEQERNQWKMAPDGSLYNTINGQRVTAPPTADARYKAAMAITGGDKEKSAFYALNGKLPAPTQHNVSEWQSYLDANGGDSTAALKAKNADDIHKAIASRDPSAAGYRNFEEQQRTQAALNQINKERVDEEQRIQSDRQAKLTALTTSGQTADRPKREAEINRAAAAALQSMQQKYAAGIRGWGGTATDFDVDPATLQWKPRVAPAVGSEASPAAVAPVTQNPATSAKPQVHAAPAPQQAGPIRVTLPNGSTKVFPDQKSLDAFAQAAGLTFSPAK